MSETRVALYAITFAISVGVAYLHGMEDQHQTIEQVDPSYSFPGGEYDLPEDLVLLYGKEMSEFYQSLNQPLGSNTMHTSDKPLTSPDNKKRKHSNVGGVNKWKVVCDECNRTFKLHVALYDHISSSHPGVNPFPCDSCHQTFTKYKDLCHHRFKCFRQNRIECDKCSMTFTSEASYDRHLHYYHGVDRSAVR